MKINPDPEKNLPNSIYKDRLIRYLPPGNDWQLLLTTLIKITWELNRGEERPEIKELRSLAFKVKDFDLDLYLKLEQAISRAIIDTLNYSGLLGFGLGITSIHTDIRNTDLWVNEAFSFLKKDD